VKSSQFKLGEKILFGIVALIFVFAGLSFVMLEIYRSRLDRPMYPTTTSFDFTPEGKKGSELFRDRGCTSCHRAVRNGTNNGVNLDGIGSRHDLTYILSFLHKPEATYETKTLDHGPSKEAAYVAALPDSELHAIAVFLSELKATQGSADARLPMPERSGFIDEMVKIWAPDSWRSQFHDLRPEAERNGNPNNERR
jgi:cytochrome c553